MPGRNIILTGAVVSSDESRRIDAQLPCGAINVQWQPCDFLDNPKTATPVVVKPSRDIVYRITYQLRGCKDEQVKSYAVHVQTPLLLDLTLLPFEGDQAPLKKVNDWFPLKTGLCLSVCLGGVGLKSDSKVTWWVNDPTQVLAPSQVQNEEGSGRYTLKVPREFDTEAEHAALVGREGRPRLVIGVRAKNGGQERTFTLDVYNQDLVDQGYVLHGH